MSTNPQSGNHNNSGVTGLSGPQLLGGMSGAMPIAPQQNQQNSESLIASFMETINSKLSNDEEKKKNEREKSVDISADPFSQYVRDRGIAPFDPQKYAAEQINEKLGDIKSHLINHQMWEDPNLKRGEALEAKKLNLKMPNLLALIDWCLFIDVCRKNIARGADPLQQFCILAAGGLEVLKTSMIYGEDAHMGITQLFGQRVEKGSHMDVREKYLECINRGSYGHRTRSGFDYISTGGGKQRVAKKKTTTRKKKNVKDPSDPEYVPPGYCLWYHKRGGCKKGANCNFIHGSLPTND